MTFQISNFKCRMPGSSAGSARYFGIRHLKFALRNDLVGVRNDPLRVHSNPLHAHNDSLCVRNDPLPVRNDLVCERNDPLHARNDLVFARNDRVAARNEAFATGNARAFSLIEVLVVVSLLSLIVLALMAVFTSTQRAFRSAVTQTDVLEGSRAVVELMAADLRAVTPSYGVSNNMVSGKPDCPVNFLVMSNVNYTPLLQTLPGASASVQRTNLLNYFFVLGRNNTKWTATGYVVDTTSSSPLYPLYRFYEETNVTYTPWLLYNDFQNAQWTNMSHLIDGVVHLTVRAYDPSGKWINGNWIAGNFQPFTNALNTPNTQAYGEAQLYMYSNTVPASVELELGVLEDQALARAESLSQNYTAQTNYLAGQSGTVHLFRQRVSIPNVDPTAYQ